MCLRISTWHYGELSLILPRPRATVADFGARRLQLAGYIIRWATYSNGGFKEGVSLTCDDELNRWQKYSYGCNELIFYPLVQWFRRGPINRQLRIFVWSDAPVHYKISMMSYMFSYCEFLLLYCAHTRAVTDDGCGDIQTVSPPGSPSP